MTTLRNEMNEWVDGRVEVGKVVNSFFQQLFKEDQDNRDWISTVHNWPALEADHWNRVNGRLSDEEIRAAVFSIGALKASGEDGYHVLFFQKCWNTIGASVCKSIRQLWEEPDKLTEVNKTLLLDPFRSVMWSINVSLKSLCKE